MIRGESIYLFGVAHPGYYGTINRNRLKQNSGQDKLEKQKQDWQNIKRFID